MAVPVIDLGGAFDIKNNLVRLSSINIGSKLLNEKQKIRNSS